MLQSDLINYFSNLTRNAADTEHLPWIDKGVSFLVMQGMFY